MTTILYVILAALAGFALGALLTQRSAVSARAELRAEKQHAAEALRNQAESMSRQTEALRAEFKAMSAEMMRTQGEALRTQHIRSLESLLRPLGNDIADFRTQFVKGHASLDGYIKALVEQTRSLGREADELAKALKGNTKLQGNWGEAVLGNLLAASGLTEGRDYELQFHTKDGETGVHIPDVVVHLPGGRNLVIDSKVSLKAFTEYVAADGVEEQQRLLKEHVASVRKHFKELAEKNYPKKVKGSIGYVLMFIPGEAAYVAAVTAEPSLSSDAYAKQVILINPTNLLMALQLAYNLWQSEQQSRSVNEIYTSAEKLYKKFSLFAQNFLKIGKSLSQAQAAYDDAQRQLSTGRGNVVSQLEGWKKKGLNPSATIPQELLEKEEAEEE